MQIWLCGCAINAFNRFFSAFWSAMVAYKLGGKRGNNLGMDRGRWGLLLKTTTTTTAGLSVNKTPLLR
jgi:hypothetical protein